MAAKIQYGQYDVPTADVCVNFGVGQPGATMLPLAKVREAAAKKFAEEEPQFLQVRRQTAPASLPIARTPRVLIFCLACARSTATLAGTRRFGKR